MFKSVFLLVLLGAVATLAQPAEEARPPYCGPNEHFEASSTACHITCDNMDLQPVTGACAYTNTCFCNKGYVRNNQGICIKRENCPPKTCPLNEHYEKDSHRCQISCATLHLEPILGPCDLNSRCFCNDGYVRNDKGICIKRGSCPKVCPLNEHYEQNTHRCQISCAILHLEPIMGPCSLNSACFCNDGYVRNDQGICIKRGSCPPKCPPFERYLNQTVQCQITCKTMALEPYMGPCWPTSGCFCLPGYVRNDCGICIRREECPKTCPLNEHYEQNTDRCQFSCANAHMEPIQRPCAINSACFCNEGYVRNDKGICIKRDSCPPKCPPFERYLNQTVQCQITCKTLPLEPYMGACWPTSGCFCVPGYVRNDAGVCIRKEQCPKPRPVCGLNEVSTNCYNDCQVTCKNRIIGDGKFCTLACTRTGCICKPDYYRHDNGTCVPLNQCSPPDCNKGESYTECGSSCPESCESRGDTCKFCTLQCVAGCFCAGKTIRAPNGTCVEPKNCPPRKCGKNEVFDKCPPTCPRTENCSNIWSKEPCDPIDCCTPSCRCKPGFFRNDQNVCISFQQCQNPVYAAAPVPAEATADATADAPADATADAPADSTAEASA